MAFTEHKITDFAHRLSDLPDQPNLSAAELKTYFDSSPEELRQAVNGICTDAERLDDRVSGIVAETFGDAIPKSMLTEELQAEIDAKATQAALETEVAALQTAVAQKCEAYFGSYTGDGTASRTIELGFTPKAVLVFNRAGQTCTGFNYYNYTGGLAVTGQPCIGALDIKAIEITEGGFTVAYDVGTNRHVTTTNNGLHHFIALR